MTTIDSLRTEERTPVGGALSATPAARTALEALCAEGGPVVLVLSRAHPSVVLCLGRADFVPGPHDVPVGTDAGIALWSDQRDELLSLSMHVTLAIDHRPDDCGGAFTLILRSVTTAHNGGPSWL
jgi:uncharacterized protein (DUF779 family)